MTADDSRWRSEYANNVLESIETNSIILELTQSGFSESDALAAIKDVRSRLQWNVGSECLVYSRSNKEWISGKITKLIMKGKHQREWLVVQYGKRNHKEIQRFSESIRAKESGHDYRYNTTLMETVIERLKEYNDESKIAEDSSLQSIPKMELSELSVQSAKVSNQMENQNIMAAEHDGFSTEAVDEKLEFETILQIHSEFVSECHGVAPSQTSQRPKYDDDDLKESSLKPLQYQSAKTLPLPKGAVPDLKLFENMEVVGNCKGFGTAKGDDDEMESEEQSLVSCPAIKRLVAVLNYYNSLMLNAVDGDELFQVKKFIEFCDKHYGQIQLMEDYMHFVSKHSDLTSSTKISAALDWKCFDEFKRCGVTARHYRDRSRVKDSIHFYIGIMDSLHFNVLHLVDVGLRVNHDDDQQADSQNEDGLVDQKMLKMSREIQLKRQRCFFERVDGTGKNGKFSLCSTVENNDGAKGRMTKMDSVLKDFQKEVGDEAAVHRLVEFMEEQRYDTETMNEDMAVYAESKQCNVRKAMQAQGDGEQFGAIRRWLRYHRVSGSSFSTGKWWAYWPWYREQTIERLMNDAHMGFGRWDNIEFGGHSMQSLCVYPHFENLKEEVLESGLISRDFWTKLFDKATRYMQSSRCKRMILSKSYDGRHDDLNFGVSYTVTVYHLMSLLLYTDSTKYCTALSETFRAIKSGETIEEMNSRNSQYYWSSRYLRELVLCFGDEASREKSPFFTGLSYELSIPQFRIGLIGPTSTSVAKEVAVRFAGEEGTLIMLKGGGSKYFNASLFSAYPEEQERVFCGSTHRETVTSVILVKSARNYKAAIGAYSIFDAILIGQKPNGVRDRELKIITESLRWFMGDDDALNNQSLDIFILETFYSFIIHKNIVYLDLWELYRMKENKIVSLVMHPLWQSSCSWNDEPINANLMKPLIFTVFRDVHQIRISANKYPFDLMSFLRVIRSVDIPQTLELILIEGWDWIDKGFTQKVKEEYAAEGINGEKEKGKGYWWWLKLCQLTKDIEVPTD